MYEQIEDMKFDIPFKVITRENVFLKNIGTITTFTLQKIEHNKIEK
jgi:hypothetical protein